MMSHYPSIPNADDLPATDVRSAWAALQQAAVVGTAFRPWAEPSGIPAGVLAALADAENVDADAATPASPERRLLRLAAGLGLYICAGTRPGKAVAGHPTRTPPPLPATAATETEATAWCTEPELLALCLELTRRTGTVAPARHLPYLLDLGAIVAANTATASATATAASATTGSVAPLRPALAAVLGVRGRWLAALNPSWHWLPDFDAVPPTPLAPPTLATSPLRPWNADGASVAVRHILDDFAATAGREGRWQDEERLTEALLLAPLEQACQLADGLAAAAMPEAFWQADLLDALRPVAALRRRLARVLAHADLLDLVALANTRTGTRTRDSATKSLAALKHRLDLVAAYLDAAAPTV